MKIGFIGAGNMATAIAKGIIEQNFVTANEVYLFDIMADKVAQLAQELGAHSCESSKALIKEVDAVILAVKPAIIQSVITEAKEDILADKVLLISIAAGTSLAKIYSFLDTREPVPVVRVMPNVNAMIGQGAAAVCANSYASKEQVQSVIGIFQAVGSAWELAEKDFSNFTALAGSSPAYAYLFIDSIARAGVKNGLPKDLATEIATQAVLGSAQMIKESKENPWTLIDRVSSPGGTTVAGFLALEDHAFISTIVKGIDATIARDQELSNQ